MFSVAPHIEIKLSSSVYLFFFSQVISVFLLVIDFTHIASEQDFLQQVQLGKFGVTITVKQLIGAASDP